MCNLGGTKQWQYLPNVKTTDQLWDNFKRILERNNSDKLKRPLSSDEFLQIKRQITKLKTPYQAGQFLYGFNGVSQVEVDRDDGKHVFLTVFDQDQIGAGNTVYQIVSQVERPAVLPGRKDRRFDTTLLINGLPVIQIEEKADGHNVNEALQQMKQYIDECQYSDIFASLQILIGITPHDAKYMANTANADQFNTDFAFRWQREADSHKVSDAYEFARDMLSIPMAHQMATNFMILDGTPNHKSIKVMRPYQMYATRRVVNKIREHQFGIDDQRIGYVWHTTGSGKTISSFKAAWLASRLPNVDKVVFMVDRVALTTQTFEEYRAYDPENSGENDSGIVTDTKNKWVLANKLKDNGNGIIVTSTQKMAALVKSDTFRKISENDSPKNKNIVFIVDEAHRSAGKMLTLIRDTFPKSAWVGYTGTPVFTNKSGSSDVPTTQEIFGDVLHVYTIQDAIRDDNVLGFKVDFKTTLSDDALKKQYLPDYFRSRYPHMSDEAIKRRISNLKDEDMDDMVEPSVYDENQKHVELVVADILKNWNKRSYNGKYNALLTTHVGGKKVSTPMAMMFYREFKRQNAKREHPLRVGITFSQEKSNSESQLGTNRSLREAMNDYNKMFGTNFDDRSVKEYTQQVIARLNRTIDDGKYFDIVIVVDQLLTGFDAPQLNTLYVDRTLRGPRLIQAYSRTNRIFDKQTKPYGRIVNYRWPSNSEKLMNEALKEYAYHSWDSSSKNIPVEYKELVIAPPYEEVVRKLHKVVGVLASSTDDFNDIPASETERDHMLQDVREYNHLMALVKQDDLYDDLHPEKLLEAIGMSADDEVMLTTTLTNRLKDAIVQDKHLLDVSQISLHMERVKEIEVDYDYLDALIAEVMNKVHKRDLKGAHESAKKVKLLADQLDNRSWAKKISRFIVNIFSGRISGVVYPVQQGNVYKLINIDNDRNIETAIDSYKKEWGLSNIPDAQLVNKIIKNHDVGTDDLNASGVIDKITQEGSSVYRSEAQSDQIRNLSKIKYQKLLRSQISKFADEIIKDY